MAVKKVRKHFDETANMQVRRIDSKKDGGWRDSAKVYLASTANLQFIRGRYAKTLATLEALYAYAMWVDVKFYMVVVEAFAALTRGDTEEAKRIANQCVSIRNKLREHHDAFTGQDLTGLTSWSII